MEKMINMVFLDTISILKCKKCEDAIELRAIIGGAAAVLLASSSGFLYRQMCLFEFFYHIYVATKRRR